MHVLVQNDTNRSGGDSPQASIGSLTFALRRLVPPVFLWSVGEIVEKTSWWDSLCGQRVNTKTSESSDDLQKRILWVFFSLNKKRICQNLSWSWFQLPYHFCSHKKISLCGYISNWDTNGFHLSTYDATKFEFSFVCTYHYRVLICMCQPFCPTAIHHDQFTPARQTDTFSDLKDLHELALKRCSLS